MGKYKWNLGVGGFCGLVVNKFHADLKEKISRRFKRKGTQILFLKNLG
jgi:hypothetical protein